jgi:hypothetical protein
MLSGIQELGQNEIKDMMKFAIRRGTNLLTFGAAGCGKTEMAIQACAEENIGFRYLNLSVLEAPDLMGLPIIDETTRTTDYALPKILPGVVSGEKPVILLVDEADKAKPELQNPMLEIFQFRSINGRPLNIKAVIATGNLPDEGAFSQPMSHALTNRCSVFRVRCDFEPWQEWAAAAGVNPLVVGFLSKNPEYLLRPPAEGDETAYCHESPRAWTNAAQDLDGTMEGGRSASVDFQSLLIAGRVGQAAAVRFRVWIEHYRYIEPMIDALCKHGTHPDLASTGVDRQLVCALASVGRVAAMCREEPKDKAKHKEEVHRVTTNVFKWLSTIPSEFCIAAVKSTLTMKSIQDYTLTHVKSFMDIFTKIRMSLKSE